MSKLSTPEQYLAAARQSPHVALKLLDRLPPESRAEALRRWALDDLARPGGEHGLRKCGARSEAASVGDRGLGAQLEAFARSIRSVRATRSDQTG